MACTQSKMTRQSKRPLTKHSQRVGYSLPPRKWLLATILLVILGAGFLCYLSTSSQQKLQAGETSDGKIILPKSTKKKHPKKIEPIQRQSEAEIASAKVSRRETLFAKTNSYVRQPGQMLTEDGRVLKFPSPKEGEFRIVHSHGKIFKCDSEGNWEDVTPKPIFDNAFEENLVGLATGTGGFIPGLLMGQSNEDIASVLTSPVKINPDDPEEVVAKKQAVQELKKDIISYIENGGTFDEYVMEMRKQTATERTAKSTALREIVKLLKEDKVEDAAAFRTAFDETAAKSGITPLKLPTHIQEILKSAITK